MSEKNNKKNKTYFIFDKEKFKSNSFGGSFEGIAFVDINKLNKKAIVRINGTFFLKPTENGIEYKEQEPELLEGIYNFDSNVSNKSNSEKLFVDLSEDDKKVFVPSEDEDFQALELDNDKKYLVVIKTKIDINTGTGKRDRYHVLSCPGFAVKDEKSGKSKIEKLSDAIKLAHDENCSPVDFSHYFSVDEINKKSKDLKINRKDMGLNFGYIKDVDANNSFKQLDQADRNIKLQFVNPSKYNLLLHEAEIKREIKEADELENNNPGSVIFDLEFLANGKIYKVDGDDPWNPKLKKLDENDEKDIKDKPGCLFENNSDYVVDSLYHLTEPVIIPASLLQKDDYTYDESGKSFSVNLACIEKTLLNGKAKKAEISNNVENVEVEYSMKNKDIPPEEPKPEGEPKPEEGQKKNNNSANFLQKALSEAIKNRRENIAETASEDGYTKVKISNPKYTFKGLNKDEKYLMFDIVDDGHGNKSLIGPFGRKEKIKLDGKEIETRIAYFGDAIKEEDKEKFEGGKKKAVKEFSLDSSKLDNFLADGSKEGETFYFNPKIKAEKSKQRDQKERSLTPEQMGNIESMTVEFNLNDFDLKSLPKTTGKVVKKPYIEFIEIKQDVEVNGVKYNFFKDKNGKSFDFKDVGLDKFGNEVKPYPWEVLKSNDEGIFKFKICNNKMYIVRLRYGNGPKDCIYIGSGNRVKLDKDFKKAKTTADEYTNPLLVVDINNISIPPEEGKAKKNKAKGEINSNKVIANIGSNFEMFVGDLIDDSTKKGPNLKVTPSVFSVSQNSVGSVKIKLDDKDQYGNKIVGIVFAKPRYKIVNKEIRDGVYEDDWSRPLEKDENGEVTLEGCEFNKNLIVRLLIEKSDGLRIRGNYIGNDIKKSKMPQSKEEIKELSLTENELNGIDKNEHLGINLNLFNLGRIFKNKSKNLDDIFKDGSLEKLKKLKEDLNAETDTGEREKKGEELKTLEDKLKVESGVNNCKSIRIVDTSTMEVSLDKNFEYEFKDVMEKDKAGKDTKEVRFGGKKINAQAIKKTFKSSNGAFQFARTEATTEDGRVVIDENKDGKSNIYENFVLKDAEGREVKIKRGYESEKGEKKELAGRTIEMKSDDSLNASVAVERTEGSYLFKNTLNAPGKTDLDVTYYSGSTTPTISKRHFENGIEVLGSKKRKDGNTITEENKVFDKETETTTVTETTKDESDRIIKIVKKEYDDYDDIEPDPDYLIKITTKEFDYDNMSKTEKIEEFDDDYKNGRKKSEETTIKTLNKETKDLEDDVDGADTKIISKSKTEYTENGLSETKTTEKYKDGNLSTKTIEETKYGSETKNPSEKKTTETDYAPENISKGCNLKEKTSIVKFVSGEERKIEDEIKHYKFETGKKSVALYEEKVEYDEGNKDKMKKKMIKEYKSINTSDNRSICKEVKENGEGYEEEENITEKKIKKIETSYEYDENDELLFRVEIIHYSDGECKKRKFDKDGSEIVDKDMSLEVRDVDDNELVTILIFLGSDQKGTLYANKDYKLFSDAGKTFVKSIKTDSGDIETTANEGEQLDVSKIDTSKNENKMYLGLKDRIDAAFKAHENAKKLSVKYDKFAAENSGCLTEDKKYFRIKFSIARANGTGPNEKEDIIYVDKDLKVWIADEKDKSKMLKLAGINLKDNDTSFEISGANSDDEQLMVGTAYLSEFLNDIKQTFQFLNQEQETKGVALEDPQIIEDSKYIELKIYVDGQFTDKYIYVNKDKELFLKDNNSNYLSLSSINSKTGDIEEAAKDEKQMLVKDIPDEIKKPDNLDKLITELLVQKTSNDKYPRFSSAKPYNPKSKDKFILIVKTDASNTKNITVTVNEERKMLDDSNKYIDIDGKEISDGLDAKDELKKKNINLDDLLEKENMINDHETNDSEDNERKFIAARADNPKTNNSFLLITGIGNVEQDPIRVTIDDEGYMKNGDDYINIDGEKVADKDKVNALKALRDKSVDISSIFLNYEEVPGYPKENKTQSEDGQEKPKDMVFYGAFSDDLKSNSCFVLSVENASGIFEFKRFKVEIEKETGFMKCDNKYIDCNGKEIENGVQPIPALTLAFRNKDHSLTQKDINNKLKEIFENPEIMPGWQPEENKKDKDKKKILDDDQKNFKSGLAFAFSALGEKDAAKVIFEMSDTEFLSLMDEIKAKAKDVLEEMASMQNVDEELNKEIKRMNDDLKKELDEKKLNPKEFVFTSDANNKDKKLSDEEKKKLEKEFKDKFDKAFYAWSRTKSKWIPGGISIATGTASLGLGGTMLAAELGVAALASVLGFSFPIMIALLSVAPVAVISACVAIGFKIKESMDRSGLKKIFDIVAKSQNDKPKENKNLEKDKKDKKQPKQKEGNKNILDLIRNNNQTFKNKLEERGRN